MPAEPKPRAPTITLRRMSREEYVEWQEHEVDAYAAEISGAADVPLELALRRAREQLAEMLPDGPDTAGMWLMRVLDDEGAEVGTLWVGPHPLREDAGYVFDVEIDPARRGQGFGRAAMLAAEGLLVEAGKRRIGLNVFGPNEGARRLYESLGYRVVSTQMLKPLG